MDVEEWKNFEKHVLKRSKIGVLDFWGEIKFWDFWSLQPLRKFPPLLCSGWQQGGEFSYRYQLIPLLLQSLKNGPILAPPSSTVWSLLVGECVWSLISLRAGGSARRWPTFFLVLAAGLPSLSRSVMILSCHWLSSGSPLWERGWSTADRKEPSSI